jgi:ABC-type dipeptide/oligopeptide/nickel transport system permease component
MGSFLVKRSLQLLLVVWGSLTLIFFLFFALPGDPAELLSGSEKFNAEQVAKVKARYGLDDPIVVQYGNYMKRVVQWDLGTSYKDNTSVNDTLNRTAKASLRLGFWAILIEVVIGIGTGIYSAVRKYSFGDALVTISTASASAIPVYVLGLLFQQMFGVFPNQHDLPGWMQFPTNGIGPDSWFLFVIPTGDQWKYTILPAITLASVSTAVIARMTRTTMLEVEKADYMRTARAKGLNERSILMRHGLRNGLIPVITLIAIDIGTVIGVAVLTETVFNWPGIGSRIARAVGQRDFAVVLGLSIVVTLLYALANLIADIIYAYLDPRVRLGQEADR